MASWRVTLIFALNRQSCIALTSRANLHYHRLIACRIHKGAASVIVNLNQFRASPRLGVEARRRPIVALLEFADLAVCDNISHSRDDKFVTHCKILWLLKFQFGGARLSRLDGDGSNELADFLIATSELRDSVRSSARFPDKPGGESSGSCRQPPSRSVASF